MSDDITSKEISAAIVANSLQINADDLINLTMDVTIAAVQRGTSEQPIRVVLSETSKFYMPSKTFRRVLVACFTDDAKNWIGQRIRLARDPDICWAGVRVGGVVITHASIAAPLILMLAQKRGKKSAVKIDVMPAVKKIDPPHTPEQKAANVATAKAAITQPETKPHARGTISGDAEEGNLDGHLPPSHPAKDDMDKMLAAFAKIGMDSAAVEREYNKPIKDWSMEDFTEAREVFKECKADWELKQAAEATQDLI